MSKIWSGSESRAAASQHIQAPLFGGSEWRPFVELASLDLDKLAMPPDRVARLTRAAREARVSALVAEAHALLDEGIARHVLTHRRQLAAVVLLFSGGADSTILAHCFRERASHAAHANTGIGIEESRQFVRSACKQWNLQLLERTAPRAVDSYRAQVLAHGFPGPGRHARMYQRLKERAFEQVRRELVSNAHRERLVFLAGRRRSESQRRHQVPAIERRGSIVWVSPLVNWTKFDMNTYRLMAGDVPTNHVTELLHMSGECLCGSFARLGERAEIEEWFPLAFAEVNELERRLVDRTDIPPWAKTWGWGADAAALARSREVPTSSPLCGGCDERAQQLTLPMSGPAA